mmetsp:Transcript_1597/g.3658  ORF Transcript_1597/g.3658 Transcript_1597/m.3658 type:complete len:348 (-) Transcript_1597:465-1508(-)
MADAVRVAEHRDLRVRLDVPHQRVGAAGDDEVDNVVQGEQLVHPLAGGDEVDECCVDIRSERLSDDAVQAGVGVCGLLPSLEQEAVARSDREGCNLGQGVWAGLKDDEADTDGRSHPLQDEAICDLHRTQGLPDGLLLLRDCPDADGELLDLLGLELEPLHERRVDARLLTQLHVLGIGSHDLLLRRLQRLGNALKNRLPGARGQRLQLPARIPCCDRSRPCIGRLGTAGRAVGRGRRGSDQGARTLPGCDLQNTIRDSVVHHHDRSARLLQAVGSRTRLLRDRSACCDHDEELSGSRLCDLRGEPCRPLYNQEARLPEELANGLPNRLSSRLARKVARSDTHLHTF